MVAKRVHHVELDKVQTAGVDVWMALYGNGTVYTFTRCTECQRRVVLSSWAQPYEEHNVCGWRRSIGK